MGKYCEAARSILVRAEQELQVLIKQAAEGRAYADLPDLAGLGEALSALIQNRARQKNRPQVVSESTSGEIGDMDCDGMDRTAPARMRKAPKPHSQSTNSKSGAEYPIFSKKDEALVKTALSGDGISTYEHRVDKPVLETILERIVTRLESKNPLLTAESLSDVACQDGCTVPSYQLYLVLGWLKHEGILRQHGRKGYSVPKADTFHKDTEKVWGKLTEGT